MGDWVKVVVLAAFMVVWAVVVLVQLRRGHAPDPITWGLPGGLWALLNPGFRRRKDAPPEAAPAETEGTP